MAQLSDIENAIARHLVTMFPARAVVQGRRGEGAEPSGPFAMWVADVVLSVGTPTVETTGIAQIVAQTTRVEISVSFEAGNAMEDARRFASSFALSQRYLDVYKFAGLLGFDGPRDLSGPQLAKYQTRADLRVILSAKLTYIDVPELVEVQCVDLVVADKSYTEHFCADKQEPPNHGCI